MRRAFLPPVVVLLAVGAAYGPDLWDRYYGPAKEFCEMYLASASGWAVALPAIGGLGAVAMTGAMIRLISHVRSLTAFDRAIGDRMVPNPPAFERAAGPVAKKFRVVCIDCEAPVAFCWGLVQPQICVSTGLIGLLDEEELRVVLAHEATHATRRDPLRALAARLLAGAAFFLPVARSLEERYLLSLEFAADKRAAQAVSLPHLASALLKLLESPSGRGAPIVGSLAFNPTEERIKRLIQEADGREGYTNGFRMFARPLAWTAGSSLLAVGVVVLSAQVISSITSCNASSL